MSERLPEVLFVVPSLGLGGVERALTSVLEELDRGRFRPSLCVLGSAGDGPTLPGDVPVAALGRRSRWTFPLLVLRLRRLLRRTHPDVTVGWSGTASFVLLAATLAMRRRPAVVVVEHIAPAQMYGSVEEPFGWAKRLLLRTLYPRADQVLAVSAGVAAQLVAEFGVPPDRVGVVHTPVEIANLSQLALDEPPLWPQGRPVVVSVGRLTPQKDHALLLRALAAVQAKTPVSAVIVGDGPEREPLERLAAQLGLAEVIFAGADRNPFRYVARADTFVLSSRFEGFGVVLVEALALGVPVVATDCPSGPREILDGGKYGLLVPVGGAAELAAALDEVLSNDELRARLGRQGPARAAAFSAPLATRALEQRIAAAARRR